MAASQVAGGTFAAALLGVGTVGTAGSAASSAASAASATSAAPVGSKEAAVEVGRQLAATGTSTTVVLIMLAALLVVAGLLLVNLARRHTPRRL